MLAVVLSRVLRSFLFEVQPKGALRIGIDMQARQTAICIQTRKNCMQIVCAGPMRFGRFSHTHRELQHSEQVLRGRIVRVVLQGRLKYLRRLCAVRKDI